MHTHTRTNMHTLLATCPPANPRIPLASQDGSSHRIHSDLSPEMLPHGLPQVVSSSKSTAMLLVSKLELPLQSPQPEWEVLCHRQSAGEAPVGEAEVSLRYNPSVVVCEPLLVYSTSDLLPSVSAVSAIKR